MSGKKKKKSVAAFCPHLKNLSEAKCKSNGRIYLVGETSRQPKIDSIYHMVISNHSYQVYSETEQVEKKEIQYVHF